MLLLLALLACHEADPTQDPIEPYDPVDLVDPFIATGGVGAQIASVSPGASMPNGLVLVGPDTRLASGAPSFYHCAGYWYGDDQIAGFAHLHAHGMGVTDYGAVLVMPRADWANGWTADRTRAAPFDHADESARPGTYAVTLQDDGTRVEIAATERAAVHQYTFEAGHAPVIVFDLGHALGDDHVEASDIALDGDTVEGFQNLHGSYSGRFGGLQVWFSATVEPEPVGGGTWVNNAGAIPGVMSASDVRVGGWVELPAGTTEATLRLAVSTVDLDGARGNRQAEVDGVSYDEARDRAEDAWQGALSTVRVRGGTESERVIFHTAAYHARLMPSLHIDADGRYRGLDGEVHTADFGYYSDLSLWDTFRTLHPWYALAAPDLQADMARSLVRMAEDGGSLPRWPLAHGYTGGMIGSAADQVLAGSYLKGIDGWDAEVGFDFAYAHATGPVANAGRGAIEAYVDEGYVSIEAGDRPASKTLEYAWSDHALALWAEALGRSDEAEVLRAHAGSWRNVWDPAAGFFRGRYADGSFDEWEDGDELRWADDFVEGNAWHYLWYVPYDVDGMIDLQHAGDTGAFLDRYAAYWDDVAAEDDDFLPDDFYWHGNEPVMHYAFLGALAGEPDLTADASRWVLANRYVADPVGLDGNDDSGTLSAWYLFAASGLFPVAGTPDYVVGSPLFERIEIDRPDGTLVIRAPGVSTDARYVQQAWLGEEPLERAVLDHQALIVAGELVLQMGEAPSEWADR